MQSNRYFIYVSIEKITLFEFSNMHCKNVINNIFENDAKQIKQQKHSNFHSMNKIKIINPFKNGLTAKHMKRIPFALESKPNKTKWQIWSVFKLIFKINWMAWHICITHVAQTHFAHFVHSFLFRFDLRNGLFNQSGASFCVKWHSTCLEWYFIKSMMFGKVSSPLKCTQSVIVHPFFECAIEATKIPDFFFFWIDLLIYTECTQQPSHWMEYFHFQNTPILKRTKKIIAKSTYLYLFSVNCYFLYRMIFHSHFHFHTKFGIWIF